MSAPAVDAEGLGRDYGATRALHQLSLRVDPGAMIGLLGPNGAGKTTAMLLLATLLRPSRGHARIFGHDVVSARSAARQRLGLVFQEPTVDPFLTVRENLEFAAALSGLSRGRAAPAIAEAIERMKLAPYENRRARELSGGWRRLVDIARATLHAPGLLILDEPTVGLDPEHRAALWAFLASLRQTRDSAILFSTHYLAEAESADEVVLLARGEAVDRGAPDDLMRPFGTALLEVDGPGASALADQVEAQHLATIIVRTPSGMRIGLGAQRDRALELAAAAPGINRTILRAPSLEDVYFARTAGALVPAAA